MSDARRVGIVRSTLIGYGVPAFTFFPPTRTAGARPEGGRAGADGGELLADGATVALFAIATLGGIMQLGEQV